MQYFIRALIPCLLFFNIACNREDTPADDAGPGNPLPSNAALKAAMSDPDATPETVALYINLFKIAQNHILFGHQDATKRGIGWANEQGTPFNPDLSDVYTVTGKYPVVLGSDFLHITSPQTGAWFDYEAWSAKELAINAYERGWVNTFAWHYHNPVSGGSFYWDQSPVKAVQAIIPGGTHHNEYKSDLQTIADFAKSLVASDGKLAPFIFRPFHEFDGNWFWWGQAHCTAEEYKALFQFTVEYLRDSLNVHNILYAWSPDRNFNTEAQLLERYPGDEYVDMIGMDNYYDLNPGADITIAAWKLSLISQYAQKKNKLAAMTETGLANISKADWYTQQLLKVLKTSGAKLVYVLVWANRSDTYWTPPKGHAAENDFIEFCKDPMLILSDRLPDLYLSPTF